VCGKIRYHILKKKKVTQQTRNIGPAIYHSEVSPTQRFMKSVYRVSSFAHLRLACGYHRNEEDSLVAIAISAFAGTLHRARLRANVGTCELFGAYVRALGLIHPFNATKGGLHWT
jgi:hypothetical protein